MLRYVGWRLVFAGALHTASAQPWPARRLIAVTSLGQRSCRKLPGGCGGQAASASAFARATPHAAPYAAPHATPHAPPHGHAKARGAASLAAPARGGNCTGLHIAINSNLRYTRPRLLLLRSLRAAGVPMGQVHVFIGGAFNGPPASPYPDADGSGGGGGGGGSGGGGGGSAPPMAEESVADGLRYHYVPHDSMDFSGLIAIAEAPPGTFGSVRQWFYMHDTTAVGPGFWGAISRWCPRLPACAMPLTCRWPSSSMGLYDAAFIASEREKTLARVKNGANLSSDAFKRQALQDEDALLKACEAQTGHGCHEVRHGSGRDACYSSAAGRHICVCNKVAVDGEPRAVYGPGSAPRQFARFPCADLTKFKANYGQHGKPYTGGDATKLAVGADGSDELTQRAATRRM